MFNKIKETVWFVATFVTAYVCYNPSLNFNSQDTSADVNVYDTYFVIEHSIILSGLIVMLFFVVYGIRMVCNRLKNLFVNCIFLITNIFFIAALYYIDGVFKSVQTLQKNNNFQLNSGFSNIIIVIQILLIIFEVFVAAKTISALRRNKKAE